jgi:hypothetical protein
MRKHFLALSLLAVVGGGLSGCGRDDHAPASKASSPATSPAATSYARQHLGDYATVKLTADVSHLSERQKQMVALLMQAADTMNGIYWQQAWGDRDALMKRISDPATRTFAELNYGPWDRLNGDHPFVEGVGQRPPGARFYPADMTRAEFDAARIKDKSGLYTLIRRDAAGKLTAVPYHIAYHDELAKAAGLLRRAAKLAGHKDFATYLDMRADALLSDDYRPSDMAWMDMKDNPVDIVIGPIETYEDQLFGYKASYESYVLIKDQAWSARLKQYAKYLPELQRELPVPSVYKREKPGSDADLNAYFVVDYAGDANAGAKTIAINLPNDEQVQLSKGTRRLQLENAMKAKFDRIMLPIGQQLIAKDQLKHLTFDAFFENTMFHEVAHGLGIKNTIDGKGTVRKALKDYASSFEEGKADVVGLFLVERLAAKGVLDKSKLMDNYVTFLDGILRSVRFGASDAHAKANMVRFNYFVQEGAFARDPATGRYRVDAERMRQAVRDLSAQILITQGDGDYAGARRMTEQLGVIKPPLAADLKRLDGAGIPVDVRFEQGPSVLGVSTPD